MMTAGERPGADLPRVERRTTSVDGLATSYLTADSGGGAVLLLLHGTYWSRVWQPVVPLLARAGIAPIAVDFPGCGRSEGELDTTTASVPALSSWLTRFVQALAPTRVLGVAGHDIGGAVAQRLVVTESADYTRLALANSVTYDSWPVPTVARYRDPAVRAATGVPEFVQARRQVLGKALGRSASDAELDDYLSPWLEPRVVRSWMSMAAAADSSYTLELVDALRADARPKLVLWGEQDTFQVVAYAERFAAEVPSTRLVRIRGGHIPMENDPDTIADELRTFFA
jgi:pimeloyl-ACP methyl ester carboxylesterase